VSEGVPQTLCVVCITESIYQKLQYIMLVQ
jgi:hypothetical protein